MQFKTTYPRIISASLAWLALVSLSLTGCALVPSPGFAETAKISAEDYYHLTELNDLTFSPNGQILVFSQQTIAEDRRSRESSLWLYALSEREPVQFTQGKQDHAPLFSPDGSQLLFRGSRNDVAGLYKIPVSGGEARLLTRVEQGSIIDTLWHPRGEFIYLTISHDPDVTDPWSKKETESPRADIHVIRDARYKRQGGYLSPSRTTLWRINADGSEPKRLLENFEHDINNLIVSPNGSRLAFASNRHPDAKDGAFANDLLILEYERDLIAVDHDAVHLSQATFIDDYNLAYISRAGAYAAPSLERINLNSNARHVIAAEMDHSPQQLWSYQQALWFTADHQGSRPLFKQPLDGSHYHSVTGEGFTTRNWATPSESAGFAWVRENETTPPELVFNRSPDNSVSAQLRPNAAWVRPFQLQGYQRFIAHGADEHPLDVFVLMPKHASATNPVPVILNIKGGPGGMWGHQWFMENQLYAARGYAVVFVNYRGSTGFGYAHQNAVRFDYGGVDFQDNMTALDAALATFTELDSDRLFITGGSHGGFLTNWATTQTQRFSAAVTQRSVSNWISEAGTQAFPPISMKEEFGGTIWENFDYYWGRSPLKYANQVSTPTLIIHSTDDHITPIGQGEEWFYALKANDVPVEMVIFSGEGHGLSRSGRPINLVERLNRIVDWFDAH